MTKFQFGRSKEEKKMRKSHSKMPSFMRHWWFTLIVFIFVCLWQKLPAFFCFIFHFKVGNICFDLLKRNTVPLVIFFLMNIFFLLSSKCTFRGTLKAHWYFFICSVCLPFRSCHGKIQKSHKERYAKIFHRSVKVSYRLHCRRRQMALQDIG